ncbi:MAG: DinB family protein [Vicinamibacterales bacterium]
MKSSCTSYAVAVVTLGLLVGAVPAMAQAPAGQTISLAAAIQRGYNGVKQNLTEMATKMPEGDYGFKPGPAPEMRTYGQLFAHVANAQFNFCSAAKGVANPRQGQNLEQTLKTKADVVKALADSFAFCDDAYSGLTDQNAGEMVKQGQNTIARAGLLANNVSHNNEMYGTGAVYMRAKGLVPPSTERAAAARAAAKK